MPTKTKTAKRKKTSSRKVASRGRLWVVMSGRMKQYGDMRMERPGQVIRPAALLHDDKLLKLGYVRPLKRHEEFETCDPCGGMFLGDSITGSYKQHLAYARHDLNKIDMDTSVKGKDGRKPRVGDSSESPDDDSRSEWDLEDEGAPPPTKVQGKSEVHSL